jgi:predicted component of type VI protein secretion system
MANITISNGEQKNTTVSVEAGGEIKIGRALDNALAIGDSRASRYHARVVSQGDAFLLEDLESTNGTRVNDRPVTRRILSQGDVIQIGKTRMTFSLNSGPARAATPAPPPVPTAPPAAKAPAKPQMVAPKVKLDVPAPKAPPKFNLDETKVINVKLVPGRGLQKRAEEGKNGAKKRPKRRPRRK